MPNPEASRVLLVEGPDDKHVVIHIRERNLPMPEFGIKDKGSVEKVLSSISSEVKVSGREAVGIMVDANDDPESRWQAVANKVRRVGVDLPSSPCPSGTIVDPIPNFPRLRLGIWLMPNNVASGELEHFIAGMIPEQDPVWPLASEYIGQIPEPAFKPKKTRRAEVHAWLAAREEPRRMGLAIKVGDFDTETAVCNEFVAWLRSLFAESGSVDEPNT